MSESLHPGEMEQAKTYQANAGTLYREARQLMDMYGRDRVSDATTLTGDEMAVMKLSTALEYLKQAEQMGATDHADLRLLIDTTKRALEERIKTI